MVAELEELKAEWRLLVAAAKGKPQRYRCEGPDGTSSWYSALDLEAAPEIPARVLREQELHQRAIDSLGFLSMGGGP